MKNWHIVILILVILVVVFWDKIKSLFSSPVDGLPVIPIDGTSCTTTAGGAGQISNGACIPVGGGGGPGGGPDESSEVRIGNAGPAILYLPYSKNCITHTTLNPYKYGPCIYTFNGKYTFINNKRFCVLDRISC